MAPEEALLDPATWRLLGRFGLSAAVAVRPGGVGLAGAWAALARGQGVHAAAWPMIEDGDGRWLSAVNAGRFAAFAREVMEAVRAPGCEAGAAGRDAGVVLDLEPPFSLVRGAIDGRRDAVKGLVALGRATEERRAGDEVIGALCRELGADGARLTLAVTPFVLLDSGRGGGWSRVFGGPWGLAAAHVNVMLYTTLIEGYSRGALRRDDARALLWDGCTAAVRGFGERASVSLGAVGAGALGDEPVYPDPAALADDVAIALGAGVRDLWLFDLGGVLARGAPERWLSAFTRPGELARRPRATVRSRSVIAALWAAGKGLGLIP